MTDQFCRWDSAEYLKTEEDIAEYLRACMEVGGDDPEFIAKAFEVISRARGLRAMFPKGACETLRILGNQPSQSQAGKGR
ncbi:transcriptional regulator [Pseudomonas sp. PCH199]|uniref:helix-turn-helix domain-containing transcriptional regulator n=1 Tax=unclassified Pseudomonas TaxID=196821 RepID=UPI000BCBBF9C|nr:MULTISPECIES: transcriptional regulator [unclassified Pseudomonas]MCW8276276.1 transcriptional regulator [Pseudomonas sp. PCH199]PAM83663.1 transcriptional regulator [Pseudomonas sp. ERMR1:02]